MNPPLAAMHTQANLHPRLQPGLAGHCRSSSRQRAVHARAAAGGPVAPPQSAAAASSRASLLQRAFQDPPQWSKFCSSLFLCGATSGTLLDGIHSVTGLQVYDLAPLQLGSIPTSWLVPPLLGTFYLVLGTLTAAADNLVASSTSSSSSSSSGGAGYYASTSSSSSRGGGSSSSSAAAATAAVRRRCAAAPYVTLCYGALAAQLQLSASLYSSGAAPGSILAALSACCAANWALLEGTPQGLALGALCSVGAPAAELVLMATTGCWHYSQPDLAGVFVSWVPCCYFFYMPAVSALARHLWQQQRERQQV